MADELTVNLPEHHNARALVEFKDARSRGGGHGAQQGQAGSPACTLGTTAGEAKRAAASSSTPANSLKVVVIGRVLAVQELALSAARRAASAALRKTVISGPTVR